MKKFVKTRTDRSRENSVSGGTLKIYNARLSKRKIFTSGNVRRCALSIYNSNNRDAKCEREPSEGAFFCHFIY